MSESIWIKVGLYVWISQTSVTSHGISYFFTFVSLYFKLIFSLSWSLLLTVHLQRSYNNVVCLCCSCQSHSPLVHPVLLFLIKGFDIVIKVSCFCLNIPKTNIRSPNPKYYLIVDSYSKKNKKTGNLFSMSLLQEFRRDGVIYPYAQKSSRIELSDAT